ncbi:MAG TPA: 3-phosphoshikimate 1-carboxyvinyltransferase, partial [Candidatus Limnocylindria bacterium]
MIATVRRARHLEGAIHVPGDKSISHRALILGSIASGESHVRRLSTGADVQSTVACMRALGVDIDKTVVHGRGMRGLQEASAPLDCGNSGTTMRLLAGLLAAQTFESELVGDQSLSRRPMDRVVKPLSMMGARADWPPLRVGGKWPLHGVEWRPPVPSAQVKSAILLAGLYADGVTVVTEPVTTRDHTELMLTAMGAKVTVDDFRVEVEAAESLQPLDIEVPGDFSAAAFWIAGAVLLKSRVRLLGVGVNPTRIAFANTLNDLGCRVQAGNQRLEANEPVADIAFGRTHFVGPVAAGGRAAAEMIDELPALAVVATQLPGRSVIAGASELRVKESDRLAAMADGLSAMGANIQVLEDGWVIDGPTRLEGARVDSVGDHRIAMALAIAGLIADGKTEIEGA